MQVKFETLEALREHLDSFMDMDEWPEIVFAALIPYPSWKKMLWDERVDITRRTLSVR